eukprot:TRINITY_DN33247_c0_g1_i1.p1 TRINITY_DN33247_c0_g1~~TRINITY_DN33247_c0_g1_i1.p1  ORF type:complete len:137 (+),score=17.63 TRINITY_DN33247_c0_g1_i1:44-412(+)
MEKEKQKGEEQPETINRIKITLTGSGVKHLESACSHIVDKTKELEFKLRGPVRMPTKTLKITTRKSPCGEGTNTWDRFEMRIHKRVIELSCPLSKVKDITAFKIQPGIDVNIDVLQMKQVPI